LRQYASSAAAPSPWLIGAAAALWAVLWFGLVLLGFGIAPRFPPGVAVAGAAAIVALIVLVLPRLAAGPAWRTAHSYALVFGAMLGSMGAGFIGFIGALPRDLGFKIVSNLVAVILMTWLGVRLRAAGQPADAK
jgi:hypothetical protein